MTTQEDWRPRNVTRSVTFINGDSSFPCQIEASPRINLVKKENKKELTYQTTSVRKFTSNNKDHKALGSINIIIPGWPA